MISQAQMAAIQIPKIMVNLFISAYTRFVLKGFDLSEKLFRALKTLVNSRKSAFVPHARLLGVVKH